jgi:diketogulonate reductase-like aldo/keto reductase
MSNQSSITLNNGVKMPLAGIGTFLLSPAEAQASVLSALKDGYRLIDTANAYQNEKAVGRAMKLSGVPREEIFLETKLWPSFYEDTDAVEKTLARLGTDYIDLLLIHQPAGNYIAGYRQMEKAYKEGKVKAIGLSNFEPEQIKEILTVCEVKPTILQTEVHPYAQQKELKAFLDKESIVIQAWYPLGHGDKALLEEGVFTDLAKKYGKSNAQIILRWHIQAGNIVIPGSKNPAHIKANFDLFDFALTADEMDKIAALNKEKRYYQSTPELLDQYVQMVPPVDAEPDNL